MWEDDSSPRLAFDVLQRPIEEGGLNLLDIQARNKAIEIIWLKIYLDFSPKRPTWAKITDLMLDRTAPTTTIKEARDNPFLQRWNIPTRGNRLECINNNTLKMMKMARKYNTNLAAICLTPNLRAKLPAWYHMLKDASERALE